MQINLNLKSMNKYIHAQNKVFTKTNSLVNTGELTRKEKQLFLDVTAKSYYFNFTHDEKIELQTEIDEDDGTPPINPPQQSFTVDGEEVNYKTYTIYGTTENINNGETITITFTDENDDVLSTTIPIIDGEFILTNYDLSILIDGEVNIRLELTSNSNIWDEGSIFIETDPSILQTISITSILNNNKIVSINGITENIANGETLTITFTDTNDDTVVIEDVEVIDNEFEATVISLTSLANGTITILIELDSDNSIYVEDDTTIEEAIPAILTINVDTTDLSNVTITGTTVNINEGDSINIIITDENNTPALTISNVFVINNEYEVVNLDLTAFSGQTTIDIELVSDDSIALSETINITSNNIQTLTITNIDNTDPLNVIINGTSTNIVDNETITLYVTAASNAAVIEESLTILNNEFSISLDLSMYPGTNIITIELDSNQDVWVEEEVEIEPLEKTITITNINHTDMSNVTITGITENIEDHEEIKIYYSDDHDAPYTFSTTNILNNAFEIILDLSEYYDNITITIELFSDIGVNCEEIFNHPAPIKTISIDSVNNTDVHNVSVSGTTENITDNTSLTLDVIDDLNDVVYSKELFVNNNEFDTTMDLSYYPGEHTIRVSLTSDSNIKDEESITIQDVISQTLTITTGSLSDPADVNIIVTSQNISNIDSFTLTIADEGSEYINLDNLHLIDNEYSTNVNLSAFVGTITITVTLDSNDGITDSIVINF